MKCVVLSIVLSLATWLGAQPTVGVLTQTEEALPGYTFFSPFSSERAFLVDNCGNLINEWDRGTDPGLAAYFLDNGLMFRTFKVFPEGPFTSASNAGGIELVDWDNNVVWRYIINTENQLSHHDAVMMPNGNILILTWELTLRDEIIALGRDPNEIAPQNFMWSEKILELEPVGNNEVNIVWEWHINDHLIQDFDSTKMNFGVIAEHPELYDINHPSLTSGNSNATRDWFHFNSIDYNESLDQILISIRNSDELWIIDHSTTTEEAAGHTGGRYGKGGDILYRWGNPSAYQFAPLSDQQFFGQHGAHWIREGLDDAGSIMVFNNGNGRPGTDFSQVDIITPPQSAPGFYTIENNQPYGPVTANTIYGDRDGETYYSAFLSNAIRLENGNTLINAGSPGRIFEINPEREIVWAYEIPLSGDTPIRQGNPARSNSNFRAYKFPTDFSGFDNVDLTPGNPIELNPVDCELLTSTDELSRVTDITYFRDTKTIIVDVEGHAVRDISIFNTQGSLIEQMIYNHHGAQLQRAYDDGIYIIIANLDNGARVSHKLMIQH